MITLVYRADFARDDVPDLDKVTRLAELRYPLHLSPAEIEAGMVVCLMSQPYSMLDVELPNCARAATIPGTVLAVREDMARVAQEAWEEDTSSEGLKQVPLPEHYGSAVTRKLLMPARRESADHGPIIGKKKKALNPQYFRRVRKPVYRVGARITGEEAPGSLQGLPLDDTPEDEEEGSDVDERCKSSYRKSKESRQTWTRLEKG